MKKRSWITVGVLVVLIVGIVWVFSTFDLAEALKKLHGG